MSFPRYPEYKDSGVEWLGEMPAHWTVAPLKRGFDVCLGKMLKPEATSPDDEYLPYLRAANIQWGGVDVTDIKNMWFSPWERQQLALKDGDLLVSEGGDVGRSAIWRGEVEACYFQNSVNRVRPIGENSTKFAYFWMSLLKDKGFIDVLCNKSTIAHFTAEKVEAVPMALPPSEEQEAIGLFLNEETSKIDGLISEQEKLIALLKEKRQAVISHAVTKGLDPNVPMKDSGIEWLGEVPAHWNIGPLKYFVRQRAGAIKTGPFGSHLTSAEMQSGEIKVYNQKSVIDGDFEAGENYISAEKFHQLSGFEVFPGDVLVTTRGTIGRAAILPDGSEQGILHPCLLRIQPESDVLDPKFLCVLIQDSSLLKVQISLLSNATTIEVIYSETMASVVVPAPPLVEQLTILEFLRGELERIDSLVSEAERGVLLLSERRSSLISAAVTGKIDVRQLAAAEAA